MNLVHSLSFAHSGTAIRSPDGEHIVAMERSSMVTGRVLRSFQGSGALFSVAFGGDAKRFASDGPGRLTLREVESGNVIRTFEGHNDIVNDLLFSTDGKRHATCTSTSISAKRRPEAKF